MKPASWLGLRFLLRPHVVLFSWATIAFAGGEESGWGLRDLGRGRRELRKFEKVDSPFIPTIYQIHTCSQLGLAYIHVFKAAGATAITNLREACAAVNGTVDRREHTGRFPPIESPESFPPPGLRLYTFVREPVERFTSAYHEANRQAVRERAVRFDSREEQESFLNNFTQEEKMAAVDVVAAELHAGNSTSYLARNLHFVAQSRFLMRRNGQPLPAVVLPLTEMEPWLAALYAGALGPNGDSGDDGGDGAGDGSGSDSGGDGGGGRSGGIVPGGLLSAAEARELAALTRAQRSRSRMDADYGMPRFIVEVPELSAETLRLLCELYSTDYCLLGFDIAASPCALHAAVVQQRCHDRAADPGDGYPLFMRGPPPPLPEPPLLSQPPQSQEQQLPPSQPLQWVLSPIGAGEAPPMVDPPALPPESTRGRRC